MKYLDEYRDEKIARGIVDELGRRATRPWVLMEICGGQTHTLDATASRNCWLAESSWCTVRDALSA